jgi:hypothetical protein
MSHRLRYYIAVAFLLPAAAAALMAVDQTPVGRRGAFDVVVVIAAVLIVAAGLVPRWRPLAAATIVLFAGSSALILLGAARLGHQSISPWNMCLSLLAALAAWRVSRHKDPAPTIAKVYRKMPRMPQAGREEVA